MLSSLSLSNFALIKKQTIDFKDGFNCLLGQSGAGKSIIIDALNFSLGAKADKGFIRTGAESLRVDAVFSNLNDVEKNFLTELEIDFDDEVIITRTLNLEGKSSIKINGYPATAKILKDLSEVMVDFCGQHDSVGLLNVNNHLSLLDRFIGKEVELLKTEVVTEFDLLKEIDSKINLIGGNEAERERLKDLLSYQLNEIDQAALQLGEEEELRERFDFISSAEKIFEKVSEALGKLEEDRENVVVSLHEAKNSLSAIANFKDIDECRERIENAYYEVKDIAEALEVVKNNTEFDPLELDRIDSRLDLIKSLSKKYGRSVEEILNYAEKCRDDLERLENSEFELEKLLREKQVQELKLQHSCEKLTELRKKFARGLEVQIESQLDDLEMKGTSFKVDFESVGCSRKGADSVKFKFSANKGQEIKDLHKTASGGELSRLLLAFKNVLLDKEMVQTVVFDEIDSGISGHTAGRLAEKLKNISNYVQIICITHTPVVAAKANNFLLVEKTVAGGETISSVRELDKNEAVVEVAKLIDGGKVASQTAIDHAKNLF